MSVSETLLSTRVVPAETASIQEPEHSQGPAPAPPWGHLREVLPGDSREASSGHSRARGGEGLSRANSPTSTSHAEGPKVTGVSCTPGRSPALSISSHIPGGFLAALGTGAAQTLQSPPLEPTGSPPSTPETQRPPGFLWIPQVAQVPQLPFLLSEETVVDTCSWRLERLPRPSAGIRTQRTDQGSRALGIARGAA